MPPADNLTAEHLDLLASVIGSPVRSVRRISSGQSATTDVLEIVSNRRRIVLRRHGAWSLRHDPEVATREAAVLRAMQSTPVPTPEVFWSGWISGRPALITGLSPGSAVLNPQDPITWGRLLAKTLTAIHDLPTQDDLQQLLRDAPPGPADDVNEEGVHAHIRGQDLLDKRRALRPPDNEVGILIHGDYHPGNVLWEDGNIAAILDWEAARIADPACDVAYCATELRLLGLDAAAEAFTAQYRATRDDELASLSYWTATAICRSIGDLESIVRSWSGLGHDEGVKTVRRRRDRIIEDVLGL